MSKAEELVAARRRVRELKERHGEIGNKFNAHVAAYRTQCDDHLRRTRFGPFLAIEKAATKARTAQAAVIDELRGLEKTMEALLQALEDEVDAATPAQAPATKAKGNGRPKAQAPATAAVDPTAAPPVDEPADDFDP